MFRWRRLHDGDVIQPILDIVVPLRHAAGETGDRLVDDIR
jgi:hypothetical protein